MDELRKKEYIDGSYKRKSVYLTDKGIKKAEEIVQKLKNLKDFK